MLAEALTQAMMATSEEERQLWEGRMCVCKGVECQPFCKMSKCGNVLDVHTAVLIESALGRFVGVLCPDCAEETLGSLPDDLEFTTYTWDRGEVKHGA